MQRYAKIKELVKKTNSYTGTDITTVRQLQELCKNGKIKALRPNKLFFVNVQSFCKVFDIPSTDLYPPKH